MRSTHWFGPRLFGEVGASLMIDPLLAFAVEFQPDVILFESRCYAAAAVARAVGALPVLQAVTTLMPPEVELLVTDAITPLWRELGLDTPSYAGVFDGLTFSAWPASLDDPAPYGDLKVHRRQSAAVASAKPSWLDSWIEEQASRPIVYATLGTVHGGNAAVLRAILDGVTANDVAVVMTVGASGDPSAFDPVSPRARVERFVPQDVLLPACSAVISHAGSGTTLGALFHALPHLMLPQGADQYINADRCGHAQLGRTLLPRQVTADAVRLALKEVLEESSYRDNARRMQKEMTEAIPLDDAVGLIRRSVLARGEPTP